MEGEWPKAEQLLRKAAGTLPEALVARLFRGVIKSVLHCHQLGILHRDIKTENFLLSADAPDAVQVVKLADFGLSCFYRRGVPETEPVGSPFYMAPEMVTPGCGYGPAADKFSCGVILYHLLTGNFPFPGNTKAEIFHALRHYPAEFASAAFRSVSPAARHLVRRLLEKDPHKRIDAHDVLTHEWMISMIDGSPTVSAPEPEDARPLAVGISPAKLVGPGTCAVSGGAGSSTHEPPSGGPQADCTTPLDADSGAPSSADVGPGSTTGLRRVSAESARPLASARPPAEAAAGPGLAAAGLPDATGLEAASTEAGHLRSRVGDQFVSARVFFLPNGEHTRMRMQYFLDSFRRVEETYQQLLQAPDADSAALYWEDVCLDLKDLNDYLVEHASRGGPFFLGSAPSIAEAATAPSLFRMAANLDAVRHIELLPACEAMGLTRLAAWIAEVLARPAEVCDVACLPPHVYVEMARKLHVKYEGPPSPVVSPSSLRRRPPSSSDSARELTPGRN